MKHGFWSFGMAGVAMLSSPAAAQVLSHAPEQTRSADEANDIVVTGQKLGASVQDTPASVVVVTGEELDRPAFRDVDDYLRGLPNVVFTGGGGLPVVRGIDANGVAFGGTGAVSGGRPRLTTYVDGVPRSFSFLPNGVPFTWDIAQLELFRGAQSTTLGRNAVAGALVTQTADPEDRWAGAAELGMRSEETSVNGAATLNVPLIDDRLALRVSANGYSGDNFVDYAGALARREDFIDRDEGWRVRAKVAWRPFGFDNDAQVRLAYERQHVRRPSGEDAVQFATARAYQQSDPLSISVFELDNELFSAEARLPVGEDWSVYGIASYQNSLEDGRPILDDGSSLDVFARSKEWTQEARVTYAPAGSRLRAVAGVFHFTRDRTEGGEPGSAFVYDAVDEAGTIALFADAVIPVGDFDLLAGARWERERQDRVFDSAFGLALDVDIKQDVFLPKGGVRWNVDADRSLSALYYRGYSPAAAGVSFLTFTPYLFGRETSDNIELAWRQSSGRVTFNANLFASWFSDQQLFGNGPEGPADSIVVNADRTRYLGAEAEAVWRALPALTLTGALGLLDSELVRFGGDPSNDLNNGNDLPSSPSATARAMARWEPSAGLELVADARYSAAYSTTYQNTPGGRVKAGALLDLRGAYDLGAVTLHVFVENLFDRFHFLSRDADSNFANVGRPRTVGASIRARF